LRLQTGEAYFTIPFRRTAIPQITVTDVASTLFRVALSGALVAHGTQKLIGWFGGDGVSGTGEAMHHLGFRPAQPHAILAGVGEAGAGAAPALGLATPAAGAGMAITMGVAAGVHLRSGFFITKSGYEYPAVLAVAAVSYAPGGSGPSSLDAVTGRVLDRPWMRAVALTAIPITTGVQFYRRNKALEADAQVSTGRLPRMDRRTSRRTEYQPGVER
jgi:putative oxidoreductase